MRRTKLVKPSPHRIWLGIFGVWVFLLTGIFSGPGVIQAIRLHSLLSAKQAELVQVQFDIDSLQSQAENLQKSPMAQEREIRRVLGYAAPDELIFDFSSGNSL